MVRHLISLFCSLLLISCSYPELNFGRSEENARSFNEELNFLSGETAINCGSTPIFFTNAEVTEKVTEKVTNCMKDAFLQYQAFRGIYTINGEFLGIGYTGVAYNGMDLVIISRNTASCSIYPEKDCSRIYTTKKCKDPIIDDRTEELRTNRYPFECAE